MPPTLKIFLLCSIFIVPIFGFSFLFYMRFKTKKIVEKYRKKEIEEATFEPIAVDPKIIDIGRDNFWSLEELQFLLNTSKMNNFQNVLIKGSTSGLEALMLVKQLFINVYVNEEDLDIEEYNFYLSNKSLFTKGVITNFDANTAIDLIIFKPSNNYDLNASFDQFWPNLRAKGLVIVVNPNPKDSKRLTNYLKITKIQHEKAQNLHNKILLITK